MNKVIDKGFRSCRFVSTIVKHPVCLLRMASAIKIHLVKVNYFADDGMTTSD